MRIALKQDVALPADATFAGATDFARLERAAARRGVRVTRTDGLATPGPGMSWNLAFRLRGRDRLVHTTLTGIGPPRRAVFAGRSDHLDVGLVISVIALSRDRSRLVVEIDIRPRTLRARVMVQSARMARSRVEARLSAQMRKFADSLAAGRPSAT